VSCRCAVCRKLDEGVWTNEHPRPGVWACSCEKCGKRFHALTEEKVCPECTVYLKPIGDRLKAVTDNELGDVLKEYVAENEHGGWEGFTPGSVEVLYAFLEDFRLYLESRRMLVDLCGCGHDVLQHEQGPMGSRGLCRKSGCRCTEFIR
jgi:hypothetical protein